ncbi:FKBP-type peptidyl-prolyl cis-trans isomerase SlyD [Comamonas sp. BIGb0124]|uniref:FKBP-type peptidyl-prolyl cis-trans isomerase n=1 Tax=Comamonas sp. BIGb0124 TaxID=2485130 RepID=UPI000F4A1BF9|nr:peptidylprolyl isomerase [Comamonas sp. BIGb0124]ROR22938.1 FKBP-type peptidyl-prolyl cis-trans isomerase SlyD [Comamonas sp. BIGb0124]
MTITKDTAVTIRYQLTDEQGRTLESSQTPIAYLHGGYDNIFPKVEAALEGQDAGFKTTVNLSVDEAFGPRDESLVRTIPKSEFPPGVKVGGQLRGHTDDGQEHVFNVLKIKGQDVMLDGNHPLAGKALKMALTVVSVRPAKAEEIAHRHVHGEHGHHH